MLARAPKTSEVSGHGFMQGHSAPACSSVGISVNSNWASSVGGGTSGEAIINNGRRFSSTFDVREISTQSNLERATERQREGWNIIEWDRVAYSCAKRDSSPTPSQSEPIQDSYERN